MSIANVGGFAQGLMRGHMYAEDERRKNEDAAFQQEQRARMRDDWGRQDRVRQGISSVQQPGVVRDPEAILNQDFTQTDAIPMRTQTQQGYYDDLSNVYAREGMLDQAEGVKDRAYNMKQRRIQEGVLGAQRLAALGDLNGAVSTLADTYKEVPDKHDIVTQRGPDGSLLTGITGPNGWAMPLQPVNKQVVDSMLGNAMKFMSTDMFTKMEDLGIKNRTVDAAQQNADTQAARWKWEQEQPKLMQDGTGRIVAISSDGRRQLGTFGNARPILGAGGAGARELPPTVVAELNSAAQAVDNARTPQERQAAQQRYMNLYSNAATLMGKVLKPGEVKGNFPGANGFDGDSAINDFNLVRQSVLANKDLDPEVKMQQLRQIDAQRSLYVLKNQIPALQPDERVPELRKLMASGMPRETLQSLGFSLREMREAEQVKRESTNGATSGSQPESSGERFPGISQQQSGTLSTLQGLVRQAGRPAEPRVNVQELKAAPVPYGVKTW